MGINDLQDFCHHTDMILSIECTGLLETVSLIYTKYYNHITIYFARQNTMDLLILYD